jgi:histidinol phosphatase-like enzyme (inositol monophosphatase family)
MTTALSSHCQARDIAIAAAQSGGRAALAYFRRPDLQVEWKSDESPVTVADRAAEAACQAVIRQNFPNDAWLGEETGESLGNSGVDNGRRWIVDPIDGTRNFVRGVPLWATLVACEEHNQVVAAAVFIPALNEMYDAVLRGGARCNGTAIRVSSIAQLDQALFCYESPAWFSKNKMEAAFAALNQRTALQRGLCDAYGHMLVASGRAEMVVEPQLSVWDVAATSLVVNEAGGRFSDIRGTPSIRSGNAVVTNGILHEATLALL